MITANWSVAAAIFDAVVDLEEPERSAYLDRACSDPVLRSDVEALLAADREASRLAPDSSFEDRPFAALLADETGSTIGPYEVVRLLGRGGMGDVYLGRRTQDFEHQVAIKSLSRFRFSRESYRRFLRERQILSQLNHPNIAQLFGGGVTTSGIPYIVMEYVDGCPVDRFCEQEEVSIERMLRLFRDVCEAVAHAHRHLVVHRDLKPSNILVSIEGRVKLLDFGIARRISGDGESDLVTEAGQVVATPKFASPEQLAGHETSTSWDIFSLGRVLELLVASCVVEPKSERVSPFAKAQERFRNEERRRDIQAVVETATATNAANRYDSVGSLLREVDRLLTFEPVEARHLRGLSAAVSFGRRRYNGVLLWAAGLAIVGMLARLAVESHELSQRREMVAEGLSTYLVSLFHVADPDVRSQHEVSALEVLDAGTIHARQYLPRESLEYQKIIREIGGLYSKIGAYRQAQNLLTEVLLGPRFEDDVFRATTYLEVGRLLHIQGSNVDAGSHLLQSLETLGTPSEETVSVHLEALNELALVAVDQNRLDVADSLAAEFERLSSLWSMSSSMSASILALRARIKWRGRDFVAAQKLYQDALQEEKRLSGPHNLKVASILNDLGLVFVDLGDLDRAGTLLHESLRIKQAVLGQNHPSIATSLANVAPVIGSQFGPDSAEIVMWRVVSIFVGSFGQNHHEVATAKNNLALFLYDAGRLEESEQQHKEALDIWRDVVGTDHPDYLIGCQNLAILLRRQNNVLEAVYYYEEAISGFRRLGGNYRKRLADALNGLGKSYKALGDLAGAAASFRESLAIRESELPEGHWRIGTARSLLGETLGLLGDTVEAKMLLRSGLRILELSRGPDDIKTSEARHRLDQFEHAEYVAVS